MRREFACIDLSTLCNVHLSSCLRVISRMLRINPKSSGVAAKRYYTGVAQAEYYSANAENTGLWGGRGAERLGLKGRVDPHHFAQLCDNLNPITGERLTLRTKGNRTVGYDFNFHPPKSVSIVHAFPQTCGITREHLERAFTRAVDDAMYEAERLAATRVRKQFRDETRPTENLCWARFVHTTTRPVNGTPDPHLHAHCFVFNATFDREENAWKAGQFREIVKRAPYLQAVFQSRLAFHLEALGLEVERRGESFEIVGIPDSVVEKFSARTRQIDDEARVLGIKDQKSKSRLGMMTREPKRQDLSEDTLGRIWTERLSEAERSALERVVRPTPRQPEGPSHLPSAKSADPNAIKAAIQYAKAYHFERLSVVDEFVLLEAALRHGLHRIDPTALRRAMKDDPDLLWSERDGRFMVTTKAVLAEEERIIDWVNSGIDACPPLARGRQIPRHHLAVDHRTAANHILSSRDRVTGIMGKAGTGKTTLMRATIDELLAADVPVAVLAPNADTGRGTLRESGFADADTVESFLSSPRRQDAMRGGVLWIDEAGLLSIIDMARIMDAAEAIDARVVFTGDTRQHRSVKRGDALRILEEHSKLRLARLTNIRRQKGLYRDIVTDLSEAKLDEAFQKMEEMGALVEIGDDASRYDFVANRYLEELDAGRSVLVVSPTHLEGSRVTERIRARLLERGTIRDERTVPVLRRIDMHEADHSNPKSYREGMILECIRNTTFGKSGDRLRIIHVDERGLVAQDNRGMQYAVNPSEDAGSFRPYDAAVLRIGIGDRIRITRNGKDESGGRLNNASLHTVEGFTEEGGFVLENGSVIPRDYAHLAHGYVTTSYAAQSKTVDTVLVAESAESFNAASWQQMYVSASRGRTRLEIVTSDKEELLRAVGASHERPYATEHILAIAQT